MYFWVFACCVTPSKGYLKLVKHWDCEQNGVTMTFSSSIASWMLALISKLQQLDTYTDGSTQMQEEWWATWMIFSRLSIPVGFGYSLYFHRGLFQDPLCLSLWYFLIIIWDRTLVYPFVSGNSFRRTCWLGYPMGVKWYPGLTGDNSQVGVAATCLLCCRIPSCCHQQKYRISRCSGVLWLTPLKTSSPGLIQKGLLGQGEYLILGFPIPNSRPAKVTRLLDNARPLAEVLEP